MKYVMRHGRRIEIETLPDQPEVAAKLRKRSKKTEEAFAIVPLWWAARACSPGGYGPNLLVCVELIHRSWKAGGESFIMPNVKGVDPKTKYRTLHLLEGAGLITVKWRIGKSPVVAMTVPTR
jgi:hypothetical protein